VTSVRKLRVGIDGRAFTSPAAGVRRYVNGLVRGLQRLGEPLDLVALGGSPPSLPPGVAHIEEPAHPPTNFGWTVVGVPRAAARARVDIVHAPAYTAPFWSPAPVVLTIHDVSYQRHPEWFPYRRDRIRRAFYRRSARAAVRILTDSAFSVSEIMAAYGIPESRLTVAPLGVDPGFAPDISARLPDAVREPYVLHVGDLHTRRNLGVVLEAVIAARRRGGELERLALVTAGVDRGLGSELSKAAVQAGAGGALIQLGAVNDDCLHALYARARALVYPSRYEGFGLPVLEAMASGTPVIASRAASIPEVLGDAGLLLDPLDVSAWTDAVVRVAGSEALRRTMAAAGLARAATFTWERTARITLDVYRQALEPAPRAHGH
jgi:glycosyltransferase involved in cell wall biosynthesis